MWSGCNRHRMRLAAILLAGLAGLVPAARADVTYYRMTFDTLVPAGPGFIAENDKRYRFRIEGGGEPLRVKRDRGGARFVVLRSGPTPDGAVKDRAEISIHSGVDWNRDWATALRFRVTDPTFPSEWQTLLQCPQSGADSPPPLSVDLEPDGTLSLVVRSEADRYEVLWNGPLSLDRWVTMALEFRMGTRGRVALWLDGVRMVERHLPLGWKESGAKRCVLKTGVYRAPTPGPFTLHLDGFTLADSLAPALRALGPAR